MGWEKNKASTRLWLSKKKISVGKITENRTSYEIIPKKHNPVLFSNSIKLLTFIRKMYILKKQRIGIEQKKIKKCKNFFHDLVIITVKN